MMEINKIAEINRVATLEASKTLSRVCEVPVTVGTVHLDVKKVSELFAIIDPDEIVVEARVPLMEDEKGVTVLLMPQETADGLASLMLKREFKPGQPLTEEKEGALKELTNIVIGNYLKAFSLSLPGTTILHGLTSLSSGRYQDLSKDLVSSLLPYEGEGLLIEITFGFSASILKGYLILAFAGGGLVKGRMIQGF